MYIYNIHFFDFKNIYIYIFANDLLHLSTQSWPPSWPPEWGWPVHHHVSPVASQEMTLLNCLYLSSKNQNCLQMQDTEGSFKRLYTYTDLLNWITQMRWMYPSVIPSEQNRLQREIFQWQIKITRNAAAQTSSTKLAWSVRQCHEQKTTR